MAKHKYTYVGELETAVQGVGIVQPGETVETNRVINNPQFIIKKKQEKKKGD